MSLYPSYKDCVWSSGCARARDKVAQTISDPSSQDAEPFRLEKKTKSIVYDESVILSQNRHGDLEYLENERLNEYYEEQLMAEMGGDLPSPSSGEEDQEAKPPADAKPARDPLPPATRPARLSAFKRSFSEDDIKLNR